MYSIVWQYEIDPSNRAKFEREYGSHGGWHELFSRSGHYLGSFLHRSDAVPGRYLLIDTWATREAYEEFIKTNSVVYNELSARFEHLYTSEQRIGAFVEV